LKRRAGKAILAGGQLVLTKARRAAPRRKPQAANSRRTATPTSSVANHRAPQPASNAVNRLANIPPPSITSKHLFIF
jgi:hypothetical protein